MVRAVGAGHADTFECLEHSRSLPGFGQRCRAEVETVIERRSLDFRLNPKLAQACQEDIHLARPYAPPPPPPLFSGV